MRYIIPLGAVLLAGAGFIPHRPLELHFRPQQQIHRDPELRREVPAMSDSAETTGTGRTAIQNKCQIPDSRVNSKSAATGVVSASSWRTTSVNLVQALGLTTLQRAGVDEVLRQRDEEIQELHSTIRSSGILDIRSFEWRVSLLKAAWYRKIDSLLDAPQHEKFVAIVENGLFNEGLAFTVEPGMTILE